MLTKHAKWSHLEKQIPKFFIRHHPANKNTLGAPYQLEDSFASVTANTFTPLEI